MSKRLRGGPRAAVTVCRLGMAAFPPGIIQIPPPLSGQESSKTVLGISGTQHSYAEHLIGGFFKIKSKNLKLKKKIRSLKIKPLFRSAGLFFQNLLFARYMWGKVVFI